MLQFLPPQQLCRQFPTTLVTMLSTSAMSAGKSSSLPRQHFFHVSDNKFQLPPSNLVSESLPLLICRILLFMVLYLSFKVDININFEPRKKIIKKISLCIFLYLLIFVRQPLPSLISSILSYLVIVSSCL